MRRHLALALLALHLAVSYGAPQNNVETDRQESSAASVVGDRRKGDASMLANYQNDQLVRTCDGTSCRLVTAGEAKAYDTSSISAVFALTGDEAMTKALTPTVGLAQESVKALDDQRERLEVLQQQMADLTSYFSNGALAAEQMKGQYAASLSKGVMLPASPPVRTYAAAMPPSKAAYASAPSKGVMSAANAMQLEAAMCPTVMYELGKSQRLYAETNSQLQNANSMNSMLMAEKRQLENNNAMLEMEKNRAEEQSAFNAKYAAEQKSRADLLEMNLARVTAERDALAAAKAQLENQLAQTEEALMDEKQMTAALTADLNACRDDNEQLEAEKAALTNELKDTKEILRLTQRSLELEQNAHARTRRELEDTKDTLAATEAARQQLEQAKAELEDELAETKDQLANTEAERDQLQTTLDATSAQLATCNEEKMQCNLDLTQEKTLTAQLNQQLANAVELLAAETKAREELTELLMSVKDTAEKLQEEVQKLQLENLQLRQQLMKLQAEQEAALAMAAGCPPTYEKFGLSCYKYVREKTQWKMAQEQCMKDGGNLVSIESRQEQAFLIDYLKRHEARFDDKYLHVGGYDYKANSVFEWISNQMPVDLGDTFWLSNNPRGMGRRCLAFQTWEMEFFGQWADEYCWAPLPFICEVVTNPF
ncbi:C-type lectin domain family 4 member F-like isoform X2 [Watersipora subatra]|uniref:C-type lectin domain family 4 member F-like isoform X2 n=1 Tax=Watersipora subatra TaxID=2589382 RepID=UPI00355C99BF